MPYKDLTNLRFGRLIVEMYAGRWPRSLGKKESTWWFCQCDCGKQHTVTGDSLVGGNTQSCGCLADENRKEHIKLCTTHGECGSKEHYAWAGARQRTTNPDHPKAETYAGRGFDPNWLHSFETFLAHVGYCPDTTQAWSLGRIDNTVGYIEGNVQWELPPQQARNRSMPSTNTSGVVGVHRGGNGEWIAKWVDCAGITHRKGFSPKKYGEDQAKQMAIDRRTAAIKELNEQGAGYSDTHGLPRQPLKEQAA